MKIDQRAASTERGALVSLWGLLGLCLFKGAVGWLTGSKALLADACHTAADCTNSFQAYLGLRNSHKDPVESRQAVSAAAVVLSSLLLVAGLEIGLSSIRGLAAGSDHTPGWGAVAAIAAGIVIREALIRYKRRQDSRLGLRTERPGEHRSDIFASLTALVGTAAAAAGSLLQMPFLYVLDPAAGLVVSVFVLRMGYRLIACVIRGAKASSVDEVEARMLLEAVQGIDGVIAVDELQTREQGHYIVVETTIRVNPRISVLEGHDVAQRVRRHLTKRFQHISDAQVQVLPYDSGYPYKSNHPDEDWSAVLQ